MFDNIGRIAAGVAATAVTGVAIYFTSRIILTGRAEPATAALPEGEAKEIAQMRDDISYLLRLLALQTEKRPMFLTSTDALRVRAIRLSWSSTHSAAELTEMLTTLKAIYDGAEKRT